MTDLDSRQPEFAIAIRGYDRLQVDEYIERLQQLLSEAEERTRAAETNGNVGDHAGVGSRISKIFELAGAEARELREKAERDTAKRLAKARSEAKGLVDSARDIAQRTAQQGMRDYEAMIRDYEQECDRVRARVSEHEARKTAVLQELRRLYDALGAASGLGAPEVGREVRAATGTSPAPVAPLPADEGEQGVIDTEEAETKVLPRSTSEAARLRKAS